jgi:hypothetical protein
VPVWCKNFSSTGTKTLGRFKADSERGRVLDCQLGQKVRRLSGSAITSDQWAVPIPTAVNSARKKPMGSTSTFCSRLGLSMLPRCASTLDRCS